MLPNVLATFIKALASFSLINHLHFLKTLKTTLLVFCLFYYISQSFLLYCMYNKH